MILAGNPKLLERSMRGLLKRRNPEEKIHRAVVQHLLARASPGLLWWHTPNGGKRGHIEGAKFKALGVKPGVSDIVAIHKGRFFALELKAIKGRPTEAQMQFVSDVNAAGGFACIAVGVDQAVKVLETWGLLKPDVGAVATTSRVA